MKRSRPVVVPMLSTSEVAAMFRVDSKTVTRWAKSGKLNAIRTMGGQLRFKEVEIRALLEKPVVPAQDAKGKE